MTSLAYIRQAYKVPAKRGRRVVFDGRPGRIVSGYSSYLRVVLDDTRARVCLHPTWHVDYLDGKGVRG